MNFVQCFTNNLLSSKSEPKQTKSTGTALAQLMEEASKKNLFSHIKKPAEWQREIREERFLPKRETDRSINKHHSTLECENSTGGLLCQ